MKTQEQALTEWASDEIFMSFDKENTGIRTCYTREAFEKFCAQHRSAFHGCEPESTMVELVDTIYAVGKEIGISLTKSGCSAEEIRQWADNFFSPQRMVLYEKFDEIIEELKGQDVLLGFLADKSGPRR